MPGAVLPLAPLTEASFPGRQAGGELLPPHRWWSLGRDQGSCRRGQGLSGAWWCQDLHGASLFLGSDTPPRALQSVKSLPNSALAGRSLTERQSWDYDLILRKEHEAQRGDVNCPRSHSRLVAEQAFLCHLSQLGTTSRPSWLALAWKSGGVGFNRKSACDCWVTLGRAPSPLGLGLLAHTAFGG